MYLLDTDVISELRKKRPDRGVRNFADELEGSPDPHYLSVLTIGELRYGVERVRLRGDEAQAELLEAWLDAITREYSEALLPVTDDICQVWGKLRAGSDDSVVDKLIAATALIHDLIVVTGNARHYQKLGVRVTDPFERDRLA